VLVSRRRRDRRDPLRAAVVLWGGWWLVLAVFFSAGTYLNSYYVAALVPAVAALCGVGLAACGPPPWPARVRLILAGTVLACVGYGAYLMSGTAAGPVALTVAALVAAVVAVPQLLPASGKTGHLIAAGFAAVAALLLPAAASVSGVVRGLGPFDTPFESAQAVQRNHTLAASVPALTKAIQRLEQATPPGAALFGTDTSGLAQNYILFSGREVLPIGGYLGNVPAPTLSTVQADINRGYVRIFVLPVSPAGRNPTVRWLESHCSLAPRPANARPEPYADFVCTPGISQVQPAPTAEAPANATPPGPTAQPAPAGPAEPAPAGPPEPAPATP
jgi:4-amino-4-deoxy-L-arabinose transferase-like glycosyltransferase